MGGPPAGCPQVFTCANGDDGYAATLPAGPPMGKEGELGRSVRSPRVVKPPLSVSRPPTAAHPPQGPPGSPGLVQGQLAREKAVAVAAGRAHCLVATASGALFSWGNSQAKQLGRSGDSKQPMPVVRSR